MLHTFWRCLCARTQLGMATSWGGQVREVRGACLVSLLQRESLTDVWQRQRQRTLTLFACVPVPRINSWLQPLATASCLGPCPCPCPTIHSETAPPAAAVHLYCGCAGRQLQQIETNSRIGVRIAIEIGFAWAGLGRCKYHPCLLSPPPPGYALLPR